MSHNPSWKIITSFILIVVAIGGWSEWFAGKMTLGKVLLLTAPSIIFVSLFKDRMSFTVTSLYIVTGYGVLRGIILPGTFLPNLRFIIPSLIIGGLLHYLFLRFGNEKELLSEKFFDEEEHEKPITLDLSQKNTPPEDEEPL